MLLLIDNYDSFTYNLFQYLSELGEEVKVVHSNKITLEEIEGMKPKQIVISSGPSTPQRAGICNDVIRHFGCSLPIFGVGLGHLCIAYCYGGSIEPAREVVYGRSSLIYHNRQGVFAGLPNPFNAALYHSLLVQREGFPDCLEVTAWTADDTIMGLRHRQYPVDGVQFHPESFMTQGGRNILRNFLAEGRAKND